MPHMSQSPPLLPLLGLIQEKICKAGQSLIALLSRCWLIDEVLAEIASLKNELADTEEAPSEDAEVNMSAHKQNLIGFSRMVQTFNK